MKLYDILKQYSESGIVPYHMPGHKRSAEFDYISPASSIDFTEVDGLDDLHAPTGILADAQERAAEVWGADESHFLVNGSTGGILAAVYALCRGRHVIMARGCHKSVYNAACISHCTVSYVMPRTSELGFFLDVTADEVRSALEEHPDTAAVIITSPTYEGVVSDVRSIADVCHAHGALLIVDAAHGAHLGFLDESIPSPVTAGADVTIMSLHKTLPSLTQTAIMHVAGTLADRDELASAIAMFETSSPSYVFMASIDGCVDLVRSRSIFDGWREKIKRIRRAAEARGMLVTPTDVFAYDESKIVLTAGGMTGCEIARILRESFRIEVEMISASYVILMTGAGDTDAMTDALIHAIENFPLPADKKNLKLPPIPSPSAVMKMADATSCKTERISLDKADGAIAAESVMAYPPGIPIVAPGEQIDSAVIDFIEKSVISGVRILTSAGEFTGKIKVVRN